MAETIDQPRYRRWVEASHGVDGIEPAMAPYIQGLGKIDAQLVQQDAAFDALSVDERGTFEQSLRLTDRFTVSRLWVLGAYEVVRALDQRVHGPPPLLTKRQRERVRGTKRAFARVRMPLAKLEPASAHRLDYPSARPSLHKQLGISWRVAKRVFVSRRKLADRLLALLTALLARRAR